MGMWYRAVCFGRPLGPWRSRQREAQDDLAENGLGERSEWGAFYITVPGDIEMKQFASTKRAA